MLFRILFAMLLSFGVMLASQAAAQFEPGVNSRNVRDVSYPGGGFMMFSDMQWVESTNHGAQFHFEDRGYDDHIRYIYDPLRDVHIGFDMTRRIIWYSQGSGPMRQLYRMTGAGRGASSSGDMHFPPAASWGGVVRSGPSVHANRLAILAEGEPITLLEDTGVQMNGYDWFRIQYQGGHSGYHWGGIICGRTQPIHGAFETCR